MATPLWARLDVRHFVALAEIVRTGSFTGAAEALGYTQSAVSQQLTRLEKQIGQRLVNRSSGGKAVSLTPAGRLMLQHGHALTGTLQRAAADVMALSAGMAGILRVGCYESAGATLLPRAMAQFATEFPQIQVVLTELPDDGELLERLERDELDVTFVVFPLTDGPFTSRALLEDPYVLVVGEQTPLAVSAGPIDLDEHPALDLMSHGDMRPVHGMESRLGRPRYGGRVVFRSNHSATLVSLAAQGYAAAVLPQLAVDATHQVGVRCLPLAKASPRIIGLAWHSNRPTSEAVRGFIDAATVAAAATTSG